MVIKIETEKIVQDGKPARKILKIEGVLREEELPSEYKCGVYIRALKGADGIYITSRGSIDVRYVEYEENFQDKVAVIRAAGNRLHEINEKIRKLKETWKGNETFLI